MSMSKSSAPFAFIAFETSNRAVNNGQMDFSSALSFCHLLGAQVARQRCPILQPGLVSLSLFSPFAKGTFLLCKLGDISTLP